MLRSFNAKEVITKIETEKTNELALLVPFIPYLIILLF